MPTLTRSVPTDSHLAHYITVSLSDTLGSMYTVFCELAFHDFSYSSEIHSQTVE